MACIGNGHLAVRIDARAEAGGEAGRGTIGYAEHHLVEMRKHCGRIMRELVAQSADQAAGVHGGLQAFAADVTDDDQHGFIFERKSLEEIPAYTVDRQIGAVQGEDLVRRQLRRDEHSLDAASGLDLSG